MDMFHGGTLFRLPHHLTQKLTTVFEALSYPGFHASPFSVASPSHSFLFEDSTSRFSTTHSVAQSENP